MTIETPRLNITALTPDQLRLWTEDLNALEAELGCSYRAEPIAGFFKDIIEGQAAKAAQDPEHYLWHTFWFMIRKTDRFVVGSIDFKDVPVDGEVEIGYGLGKEYEHEGYMTEAADAFCRWALSRDGVKSVIAETEPDNTASQNILLRCGFEEYSREETVWWRLNKIKEGRI